MRLPKVFFLIPIRLEYGANESIVSAQFLTRDLILQFERRASVSVATCKYRQTELRLKPNSSSTLKPRPERGAGLVLLCWAPWRGLQELPWFSVLLFGASSDFQSPPRSCRRLGLGWRDFLDAFLKLQQQ